MLDGFKFWKPAQYKKSYSQSGEDLIVDFLLEMLGVGDPTYLDVGAHDPVRYSNTYFLYERGYRGVLVEPNSVKCTDIEKVRPGDVCLQVGLGKRAAKAKKLYVMDRDTLSTFNKQEALEMEDNSEAKILEVVELPITTGKKVVEKYFDGRAPDFLSVDTEGYELEVLSGCGLKKLRPKIVCVETISYSTSGRGKKDKEVLRLMKKMGYKNYADTYINTIFVDGKVFGL